MRKFHITGVWLLLVLLLCHKSSWAHTLVHSRKTRQTTGLTCFRCLGSATPEECEMTTVCSPHEECVTREEIVEDEIINYNLGCKNKQVCDILRRFHLSGECEKCCSTPYCNNKLCKQFGLKDIQCHMGEDLEKPNEAEKILTCEPGEVCYSTKLVTDEQLSRYYLGCSSPQACANTSHLLEYISITPTQVKEIDCAECCTESFCNRDKCRTD